MMEVIQKSSGLSRKQIADRLYLAHKENNIPIFLIDFSLYDSGKNEITPSFPYLGREERRKIVYGFFAGGSPRVRRKNGVEPLSEWEKPVRCVMSYYPDKQLQIFDSLIVGSGISKHMPAKMSENLMQSFARDFIESCNIGTESVVYLGITNQDRLRKTIETSSRYKNLEDSIIGVIRFFDGFEYSFPTGSISYSPSLDKQFNKFCDILGSEGSVKKITEHFTGLNSNEIPDALINKFKLVKYISYMDKIARAE